MTTNSFFPPCVSSADVITTLQQRGYAVLDAQAVSTLSHIDVAVLEALHPSWNDLPPDLYLKDGGRYRRRRHASYVVHGDSVEPVAHRAHWQPRRNPRGPSYCRPWAPCVQN